MAKPKMPKMPKIKAVKAPKIEGMKKPGVGKAKGGGGGKVKFPTVTPTVLTPMVDILKAAQKRFKV